MPPLSRPGKERKTCCERQFVGLGGLCPVGSGWGVCSRALSACRARHLLGQVFESVRVHGHRGLVFLVKGWHHAIERGLLAERGGRCDSYSKFHSVPNAGDYSC